jgi:transposase
VNVHLAEEDQKQVSEMVRKGEQSARVLRRVLILQQLDQGQKASQVARNLAIAPKTVRAIARRYEEEGLEQAMYEKPRPGGPGKPLLDDEQKEQIIAMVCSEPPAGRKRWTLQLISQEAVKRKLVSTVGRETILRFLLQNHDLMPWRKTAGA